MALSAVVALPCLSPIASRPGVFPNFLFHELGVSVVYSRGLLLEDVLLQVVRLAGAYRSCSRVSKVGCGHARVTIVYGSYGSYYYYSRDGAYLSHIALIEHMCN